MYITTRIFGATIIGACSIGMILGAWMSLSSSRYTTVSEIIPPENGYDVFLQIMKNCSLQHLVTISNCTHNYEQLWVDTNATYNYYVINMDTGERTLINE